MEVTRYVQGAITRNVTVTFHIGIFIPFRRSFPGCVCKCNAVQWFNVKNNLRRYETDVYDKNYFNVKLVSTPLTLMPRFNVSYDVTAP